MNESTITLLAAGETRGNTMSDLLLLLLAMLLSISTSLLVIRYLKKVLAGLVNNACPQYGGEFWLRILNLLLVMAPLLLVISFGDFEPGYSFVRAIKSVIAPILIGHSLALLVLARLVWKSFVEPAQKAARLV